jgi:parallel beta-helix repeat protein
MKRKLLTIGMVWALVLGPIPARSLVQVPVTKTTVSDLLLNPDSSPRKGKVTFILTQAATGPEGLISASATVSAVLDNTGRFTVKLFPSAGLSPQSYYQVWFAADGNLNRELIGLYSIPASGAIVTLAPNKVTDTNLVARYVFADQTSVNNLSATAAQAALSTIAGGLTDKKLQQWDSANQKFKDSPVREITGGAETSGNHNVTGNLMAQNLTGNGSGITGIAGATGGISNIGSTSIIADSDINGVGVVDQIVGVTSITRANADRFQLFKPLEPLSQTVAQIATAPEGTISRATDANRGLYLNKAGRAVALNGGEFDAAIFGLGASATALENDTAISAVLSAASDGGTICLPCGTFNFSATITLQQNRTQLRGQGDCTILNYTGAGNALDFNGKQYCKVSDLTIKTTTGAVGLNLPFVSHWAKIDKVKVEGFLGAGLRLVSTFYTTITNCDIYNNVTGIELRSEAKGNQVAGNALRENKTGIRIWDVAPGGVSAGNTISGNTIEASFAGSLYGIEVAGGYSNVVLGNRLEYTVGTSHIYVDAGSTSVSNFNQFFGNVFEGTIPSYKIGDGAGSSQAQQTLIVGGRGGVITIGADAINTKIVAAPGAFVGTFTDNGLGSDIDIDATNGSRYTKPVGQAAHVFKVVTGGGSTVLDYGLNYEQVNFTGATDAHQRKIVDIGGTKVPVVRIGAWRLWVDDSGRLRIQGSDPTSLTGGTIVGTQN